MKANNDFYLECSVFQDQHSVFLNSSPDLLVTSKLNKSSETDGCTPIQESSYFLFIPNFNAIE